jgi:hypothetical protein
MGKAGRTRLWIASVMVAVAGVVGLMLAGPVSATTSGGQTVKTTIHLPAYGMDNLCNGAEPVILSGDLNITTRSTPDRRGGYTAQSSAVAHNLKGQGLLSMLRYEGDDVEDSNAHYAPPPYPSSFSDAHYQRLVPEGPAPSMWLVVVLRETTAADGTTMPTLDRMYLTCHGPSGR